MDKYRQKQWLTYGIIFLAFFFIAFNTPYCHDEWRWGIDEHLQLFYQGFMGYNGRLLGNLLALMITRVAILKAVVIAVFVTLFAWLCQLLYGISEDMMGAFMAIILLLLMPASLFAQIIGWSAAFVNFFPPVVLLMAVLYHLRSLAEDGGYSSGKYSFIYLFLLGVAMELFSENNSIYGVAFAVFITGYGYYREKRLHKDWLSLLFGTVTGCLIMFLNPAYINASAGTDGYKEIGVQGEEGFLSFLLSKYKAMAEPLFTDNTAVILVISGLVIFLLIREIKSRDRYRWLSRGSILFFGAVALFMVGASPCVGGRADLFGELYTELTLMFSLGFFVVVLLCFLAYTKGASRRRLVFYTLSALLITAPLIMAEPIGARCFISAYCFMILIVLELTVYLGVPQAAGKYRLKPLITAGALILMTYYAVVMAETGVQYRQWLSEMDRVRAKGEKVLVLRELPNSQYFWTTKPSNEKWEEFFKEFYRIEKDVAIKWTE